MKGIIIGKGGHQTIGENILKFINWIKREKNKDIIDVDDDEIIELWKEFSLKWICY